MIDNIVYLFRKLLVRLHNFSLQENHEIETNFRDKK